MLLDLYILQNFFTEPASVAYEQDLVRLYGRDAVSAAIAGGYLEHRRIPCGRGMKRCVCRLSEKGRERAQTTIYDQ